VTPAIDIGKAHMRYLDRLISLGRPHASKRADWLKYCHVCGVDISHSPRGVRVCTRCEETRLDQRQHHRAAYQREQTTRRRWTLRINQVAARKGLR
jgi:hypothetical protein